MNVAEFEAKVFELNQKLVWGGYSVGRAVCTAQVLLKTSEISRELAQLVVSEYVERVRANTNNNAGERFEEKVLKISQLSDRDWDALDIPGNLQPYQLFDFVAQHA